MPSLWADTLEEHRSLVLARLLDAYEEIHQEVGMDDVTLTAVARRAQIARSAIYNYVPDKHGLIMAHAARSIDRSRVRLEDAVNVQDSARDRLATYVGHSLQMHASQTGAGDDLMPLLTAQDQVRLLGMLAPLRALLEGIIADGVDEGTLIGDPADLVSVVWAVIAGFRMPIAAGRVDPERAGQAAVAVLLDGMGGHDQLPPTTST